jgi:ABC-2 type transport system permease protein
MKRSHYVILASLAAVTIFAGLNLASWKWLGGARADFTANGLYTLSTSAKRVVQRLIEPVELELVYSRSLGADFPAIRAHADRVRQLMAEIAAQSDGKVKLREVEPEAFSEEEDRVVAAGMSPAPTDGGEPLYFGIIGHNTSADHIAIPFLAPERDALLEYELVRLISQLDDPAPPKVAVLSSLLPYQLHPTEGGSAFMLREGARAYEIVIVEEDFRALPEDTDVLLMVHPPAMDEWQSYVIDQFLLNKGAALIALDPVSRAAIVQGAGAPVASSLGQIGQMLGLAEDTDVVADASLALPVNVDIGGGRVAQVGQPLFPAPPPALMSREDVITADLSRPINFGAPGRLIVKPPPGVTFEPLVSSSVEAAFVTPEVAASDPGPREVMQALMPAGGNQVLAGRLSGPLRSTFERPPVPADDEDPVLAELRRQEMARQPPFVADSQQDAQIILVADSDMFDDSFFVHPQSGQPLADNAAFVLNALDNLGGDPALTELRSRAPAARPMARVDDLREAARARLFAEQERLEALLKQAEERIGALEARRAGGAASTPEELAEINAYRFEAAEIRGQLRGVEREFRRDIDALENLLVFLNVWLPPILVGLAGIAVFFWRGRKRGGAT